MIDLIYFFDSVTLVNRQPNRNRPSFFRGVYQHRLKHAPTMRIRKLMEFYMLKESNALERPAGGSTDRIDYTL